MTFLLKIKQSLWKIMNIEHWVQNAVYTLLLFQWNFSFCASKIIMIIYQNSSMLYVRYFFGGFFFLLFISFWHRRNRKGLLKIESKSYREYLVFGKTHTKPFSNDDFSSSSSSFSYKNRVYRLHTASRIAHQLGRCDEVIVCDQQPFNIQLKTPNEIFNAL